MAESGEGPPPYDDGEAPIARTKQPLSFTRDPDATTIPRLRKEWGTYRGLQKHLVTLTPKVKESILRSVLEGDTYETACEKAGVSYAAFQSERRRAEEDAEPTALAFWEAAKMARATFLSEMRRIVVEHAVGVWEETETETERTLQKKVRTKDPQTGEILIGYEGVPETTKTKTRAFKRDPELALKILSRRDRAHYNPNLPVDEERMTPDERARDFIGLVRGALGQVRAPLSLPAQGTAGPDPEDAAGGDAP